MSFVKRVSKIVAERDEEYDDNSEVMKAFMAKHKAELVDIGQKFKAMSKEFDSKIAANGKNEEDVWHVVDNLSAVIFSLGSLDLPRLRKSVTHLERGITKPE